MIRSKDQVLNYFQKFHVVVKQETWLLLNAVHSDNEGEYTSLFEEYCRKHWIKHETVFLKTMQQNELADRIYRTIFEKVQSILSCAKLSKIFLDETVCTTTDIINLSPMSNFSTLLYTA